MCLGDLVKLNNVIQQRNHFEDTHVKSSAQTVMTRRMVCIVYNLDMFTILSKHFILCNSLH